MEDPVYAILVVSGCEDVRDDQFSATGHDYGIVAEIGVFKKNACVFFVDANCVLDSCGFSCSVNEGSIL